MTERTDGERLAVLETLVQGLRGDVADMGDRLVAEIGATRAQTVSRGEWVQDAARQDMALANLKTEVLGRIKALESGRPSMVTILTALAAIAGLVLGVTDRLYGG